MPPRKKGSSRNAQLHPQVVHSDYDTDTANATDTVATTNMAPLPARTNTDLNLAVLRRYAPHTERIIAIAPFAVVYVFSPDTQQWEKSGHEGTLFVCQLAAPGTTHPRYNVILLNRKSLDNFVTELVSGENVEITEQYIILQVLADDGTPNIYGLWIFSDDDAPGTKEFVANAIQECAVRAEYAEAGEEEGEDGGSPATAVPSYNLDGAVASSTLHDMPSDQTQPAGQQIDLLSLFAKPAAHQTMPTQNGAAGHHSAAPSGPPFSSTADTDFFRSSHSPAAAAQQQTQRPAQQNALLDLFKSAKNG
ncbi:hypothetical protein BDY17DRAFT_295781 [Neohortaea acidophila]|uniref:PH domain-like protein n=1 Tax=Neohortaea acidophila TaxID=245834 RepID=A0A6A6PYF6_9PEZI|nr:uncharacterized protein BDY17DRAFT_295781 [Neohortaea acidophila]KAF2484503.1 hypothetical protein BDY17DRAFT_295781 [Neohortaea acidophila]